MTPVIFKYEKGSRTQVFAVFPTLAGDDDPETMACYAHIGQHGTAHMAYVRECRPAPTSAYIPLLQELQSIGYDDLVIRSRMTYNDYRTRRDFLAQRNT